MFCRGKRRVELVVAEEDEEKIRMQLYFVHQLAMQAQCQR